MQLFENLEFEGAKNQNTEKINFKVVQMKFLAMLITNQKLSFDILIFLYDFWHKRKMYNFDPNSVFFSYS